MSTSVHKKPNSLIGETSPYLLQHAYNPVHWVPFSPQAFETAQASNKLVLISIGYSACHWCHVMERESFEDKTVAELMNRHFVCIKVDREERSDVDMLYMQAVQLMTGQGGWPLNCFTLPDGRPVYGGTYFRKEQWMHVLSSLSGLQEKDPGKVAEFAEQLTSGIVQAEKMTTAGRPAALTPELLDDCVQQWKKRLDNIEGGPDRAPKFPLPNNYQFLLRYAVLKHDQPLLDHVNLTLTKMAFGGIYDQLHGGFSRYSTDAEWKVPHFEKMLYDNSQLASLYCEAYAHTGNTLFRDVVFETLGFVQREWSAGQGAFFSALDADSEGEEGRYYVWTREELTDLLGNDYELFSKYYKINDKGYWEHGNYILMREADVTQLLTAFGLTATQLREKIDHCRRVLVQAAGSRTKPGLDDKSITSWNAMMCTAFAKAYLTFGNEEHRRIALDSINFIQTTLVRPDGSLYRTFKNGTAKIDGFLEDYAFTIEALMNCYLVSQNEDYLIRARALCTYTLGQFNNTNSHFLYYTDKGGASLVARTTETSDNVIPASNSQMALNLFYLGQYFDHTPWIERAGRMLENVSDDLRHYGAGYSNWGCLALHILFPYRQVAIVGKNVDENLRTLYKQGLTNTIFAVSPATSGLPLLTARHVPGKTVIYVCEDNVCQLPVETVAEALTQLE